MPWRHYRSDSHQFTVDGHPMARIKLSDRGWIVFYRSVIDGPWKSASGIFRTTAAAKASAERRQGRGLEASIAKSVS